MVAADKGYWPQHGSECGWRDAQIWFIAANGSVPDHRVVRFYDAKEDREQVKTYMHWDQIIVSDRDTKTFIDLGEWPEA